MKKNTISLLVSIILAAAIYISLTVEVNILHLVISLFCSLRQLLIALVVSMIFQIIIISLLSEIAIRKFNLSIKYIWITIVTLFFLFSFYTFPSFYMLIFTGGAEMFGKTYSISKPAESFLITGEISVILLFLIVLRNNKLK